jgi:hypothetical protein
MAAGDALAGADLSGPGDDVASVDMEDHVSRTCETVYAA